MKKSLIWLAGIVLVGLLMFGWVSGTYNRFISKNETVENEWAQVETQYQRRFDLIPNLVSSTKGFMKQEQKVFGDIAEARTRYAGSKPLTNERVEATNQYESAIGRLLVIMENYPELKSSETVRALMDELAGTENRVLIARQRYNDQVKEFNVIAKRFPSNLIAKFFGFEIKLFYNSDEKVSEVPKIEL